MKRIILLITMLGVSQSAWLSTSSARSPYRVDDVDNGGFNPQERPETGGSASRPRGPSAADWVGVFASLINEAVRQRPQQPQQQRRQQFVPPRQPQAIRRQQPQYIPRSTTVQNRVITTPTRITLRKNTIKRSKPSATEPVDNESVGELALSYLSNSYNAATDAATIEETEKMSTFNDLSIQEELKGKYEEAFLAQNKEKRDKYKKLLESFESEVMNGDGSADSFEAWKNGKLRDADDGSLDLGSIPNKVEFGSDSRRLGEGVASGALNDVERGDLIARLKESSIIISAADGWGASTSSSARNSRILTGQLAEIEKLHTYDQLTDQYGSGGGGITGYPPISTLYYGAESAGLSTCLASYATGLPLADFPPVVDSSVSLETASSVRLNNPADTENTVYYSLDSGGQHSLESGESASHSTSTITFDNGKGVTKKYGVEKGDYKWSQDESGWNLYKSVIKILISNDAMSTPFHYVVDNKSQTLEPGQRLTHKSSGPIEVRFNRGDDGGPARKVLGKGDYYVGVDPNEERIDLFDRPVVDESLPTPPEMTEMVDEMRHYPAGSRRRSDAMAELHSQLRFSEPSDNGRPTAKVSRENRAAALLRKLGGSKKSDFSFNMIDN